MIRPTSRTDTKRAIFRRRVPTDIQKISSPIKLEIHFPEKYGERERKFPITPKLEFKSSYYTALPALIAERHALLLQATDLYIWRMRSLNKSLTAYQVGVYAKEIHKFYYMYCERKDLPVHNDEILSVFGAMLDEVACAGAHKLDYKKYEGVLPFTQAKSYEEWTGPISEFDMETLEKMRNMGRYPAHNFTQEAVISRVGAVTEWWLSLHEIVLVDREKERLIYAVDQLFGQYEFKMVKTTESVEALDISNVQKSAEKPQSDRTLAVLFDEWESFKKRSYNTTRQWRPVIVKFAAFLGHERIADITQADIEKWQSHLYNVSSSKRSVDGTYLKCLKALFSFAKQKKWIVVDPAKDVMLSTGNRDEVQKESYEEKHVQDILKAAKASTSPRTRWLSWLLALTGARIGELSQLWSDQISIKEGIHVINIRSSKDGGPIKTKKSIRAVPIHQQLIDDGFLDFVMTRKGKPLFYEPRKTSPGRKHMCDTVAATNAKWIANMGLKVENVDPNHGFRHYFKSRCCRLKIPDSVANAIQGHSTPGEASRYRHVDLQTKKDAIDLFLV